MARPEGFLQRPGAVIAFGSINIDLVCRAPKIPAPGETILAPSYEIFAGGKGANQAGAAARAGANVRMVGAIGRDAFAEIPRAALRAAGVNIDYIHAVDAPTGAAFITVAPDGENAITVASGANRVVKAAMVGEAAWAGASHVMLQGELNWCETHAVASEAKRRGVFVMLNAAPSGNITPAILRQVDLLVVNQHELADVARCLAVGGGHFSECARRVCNEADCTVVVTLGKDGIAVFGRDGETKMSAHPVSVVDTTGAGDTFSGVVVAMLAEGCDLKTALARANVAAGLSCTKAGAQSAMPARQEILDALQAG